MCPEQYRQTIRQRIDVDYDSPLSFNVATSVLLAYSRIALVASQHTAVSDADKKEMEVAHEILNGLIQNYFEVVSCTINNAQWSVQKCIIR